MPKVSHRNPHGFGWWNPKFRVLVSAPSVKKIPSFPSEVGSGVVTGTEHEAHSLLNAWIRPEMGGLNQAKCGDFTIDIWDFTKRIGIEPTRSHVHPKIGIDPTKAGIQTNHQVGIQAAKVLFNSSKSWHFTNPIIDWTNTRIEIKLRTWQIKALCSNLIPLSVTREKATCTVPNLGDWNLKRTLDFLHRSFDPLRLDRAFNNRSFQAVARLLRVRILWFYSYL